ncbi:hypothetical protein MBO12_07005, partial [Candidatus Saccharibacteria bacterium]|nr:hypothetical protein [Candidatus Saccharibacteria bacterium]
NKQHIRWRRIQDIKKLDTLSSSQTTHSQEKPTNQTSLHAFLKAPEKLTLKVFISQVPDQ